MVNSFKLEEEKLLKPIAINSLRSIKPEDEPG
jgi:hypothetical protein